METVNIKAGPTKWVCSMYDGESAVCVCVCVCVMCRAGFCSPEGHGSLFTADSFYVNRTPTPEHLAASPMCQKHKSVFRLFEMHYSKRSPTWSLDLAVWQKRVRAANIGLLNLVSWVTEAASTMTQVLYHICPTVTAQGFQWKKNKKNTYAA